MRNWNNSLLLFLCLSGATAFAQNFSGGLFLGMSASQIRGDHFGGYNKPGINVGFFTSRPVGEKSELQLELAFVQKGARQTVTDSTNGYRVQLGYIEVPLIYRYYWKDLSFEVGLGADINVTSKEEAGGFERESYPAYARLSLMSIVGISWHFSEQMYINFRTNNSLSRIREKLPNSAPAGISRYGQRNNILTFALVYDFGKD